MSHRTVSQTAWGPAAVTTLVVLTGTAVGILIGTALFWITVTGNPRVVAQTVAGSAIVVDVACMAEIARRLHRGRP